MYKNVLPLLCDLMVYDEAVAIAHSITHEEIRSDGIGMICQSLAHGKQMDRAFELVQEIPVEAIREEFLWDLNQRYNAEGI